MSKFSTDSLIMMGLRTISMVVLASNGALADEKRPILMDPLLICVYCGLMLSAVITCSFC